MIGFIDQTVRIFILLCLTFVAESLAFLGGSNTQQLTACALILCVLMMMRCYTRPAAKAIEASHIRKEF